LASAKLKVYPQPGWHEQDPRDWVQAIDICIAQAVTDFKKLGHDIRDLKTMGITNQRETTIVWDKTTGKSRKPTSPNTSSLLSSKTDFAFSCL
jgi:glycerol kinase